MVQIDFSEEQEQLISEQYAIARTKELTENPLVRLAIHGTINYSLIGLDMIIKKISHSFL